MMDKKPVIQTWIERVLEQNIDWDAECSDPCFKSEDLAEAITKAHEEEVAEAQKDDLRSISYLRDLLGMSEIEMGKLRVQVALMSDGLRGIRDEVEPSIHLSSMDLSVWNMAVDTLCLSAAPKVLYHTAAKWDDSDDLIYPVIYYSWHQGIRPVDFAMKVPSTYEKMPGQQVKVFAVECPPKAEQPEESEQPTESEEG